MQPEPDRPSAGWLRITNGLNLIPVKRAKGLHVNERAKEAKREREKASSCERDAVVVCACASEVARAKALARERKQARERSSARFGVSPARRTFTTCL